MGNSNLVNKLKVPFHKAWGGIEHLYSLGTSAKSVMADWDDNYARHHVTPNFHAHDYNEITPEMLKQDGIRILVNDIDGNVMGYHAKAVEDQFMNNFNAHQEAVDLMYILSNSGEKRFVELGTIKDLKNLAVMGMYEAENSDGTTVRAYRKFHNGIDTIWIASINGEKEKVYEEKIDFGEHLRGKKRPDFLTKYSKEHNFTNFERMKKPNSALHYFIKEDAQEQLGEKIQDEQFGYIGDRISTEIAMAGKVGAKKYWVDEFVGKRKEHIAVRKMGRPIERHYAKKHDFFYKYGPLDMSNVFDRHPEFTMQDLKGILREMYRGPKPAA